MGMVMGVGASAAERVAAQKQGERDQIGQGEEGRS